jgi:hypothetical protein
MSVPPLLARYDFELYAGTNGFGDSFSVLYAHVPLDPYLELAGMEHEPQSRTHFGQIARAMAETDSEVRFIAAALDQSATLEPAAVTAPVPAIMSDVLEQALAEVERSLAERRPATGVDRVHTAFHAYLLGLVRDAGLPTGADPGITDLLRTLRQSHPALQPTGPQSADITRVLQAQATIVHSLNPLRNRASMAHPTDALLGDAEAMLVINSVRTLLHYIDTKLRTR